MFLSLSLPSSLSLSLSLSLSQNQRTYVSSDKDLKINKIKSINVSSGEDLKTKVLLFKNVLALAGVAQWTEHQPAN